jgi:hypothetical protein
MNAPGRRSFVPAVVDGLDDDQQIAITELLLARDATPRWAEAEPPVGVCR